MSSRRGNPDRDRLARGSTPPDEHPASGAGPVEYRPDPHYGHHTLRETFVGDMAWPMSAFADFEEAAVARGHMERVGHILQRLELDQLDIIQLRTETREILARLAA